MLLNKQIEYTLQVTRQVKQTGTVSLV